MRLYTVSSIDSIQMKKVVVRMGKITDKMEPRLGKNGGQLVNTDGIISSHAECMKFVARKQAEGCISTSDIRHWKGA